MIAAGLRMPAPSEMAVSAPVRAKMAKRGHEERQEQSSAEAN